MIHADPDIEDMLGDFFSSEVDPERVHRIEADGTWPADLWDKAERSEIPWIGVAAEAGGVGGTLADAAALIRHAAYHAAPLPLMQHHLAAHVVEVAGLESLTGLLAVAGLDPRDDVTLREGRLSGRAHGVAYAADVSSVVVLAGDAQGAVTAAVLDPADVESARGLDLAGTPVFDLDLSDLEPRAVAPVDDVAAVRRRAEVLRLAALAGLQHRLLDLTRAYTSERHQFGKPVGAFQAVQIHLVTLAQSASLSLLAVDRAVAAVAGGAGAFEVDAAAVAVEEAAGLAAASAHQAHGAIGMTREYPLQQITRRVHALRQRWEPLGVVQDRVAEHALATPSLAQLVARHPQEEGRSA